MIFNSEICKKIILNLLENLKKLPNQKKIQG